MNGADDKNETAETKAIQLLGGVKAKWLSILEVIVVSVIMSIMMSWTYDGMRVNQLFDKTVFGKYVSAWTYSCKLQIVFVLNTSVSSANGILHSGLTARSVDGIIVNNRSQRLGGRLSKAPPPRMCLVCRCCRLCDRIGGGNFKNWDVQERFVCFAGEREFVIRDVCLHSCVCLMCVMKKVINVVRLQTLDLYQCSRTNIYALWRSFGLTDQLQ